MVIVWLAGTRWQCPHADALQETHEPGGEFQASWGAAGQQQQAPSPGRPKESKGQCLPSTIRLGRRRQMRSDSLYLEVPVENAKLVAVIQAKKKLVHEELDL